MATSRIFQSKYAVYEITQEELWFQYAESRIAEAISQGRWLKAQETANEWADGVCARLGLSNPGLWKFFKRSLVTYWFGRVERRKFSSGWSVEEALEYANSFARRSVRFSLFPKDIACHAKSLRLPVDQKDEWERILAEADNSEAMEMFPEPPIDDVICFRRYTTLFGEEIYYEAGKGQAMFVFEQERGQHPVIIASKKDREYIYTKTCPGKQHIEIAQEIEMKLKDLIDIHDSNLASTCSSMCNMLGIDYTSIEGYFDSSTPDKLLVVDIDLPFDIAFMTPNAQQ
jgi:hypothetical protein